ncbi:MAG: peptidoglycan bridge formation glycyltransferase FemA/FemB family protein [Oscillospiraceae bacterium]|jgi:lipid II:glycine glycyltransferase (peptidoglycan interpeptide bridge formation enzyme)|nr:peptidoglycan bridge formation glycyltransferase FemA/FemB family protein [Oscillospiraceae bacterium]
MYEFVDSSHAQELDAFVNRHPHGHFMQTSAWGRVKVSWKWTGILCRNEKREITGTMAVLCHRVRMTGSSLLYAPRGPIFSDADAFRELIEAANLLAQKHRAYLLRIDPAIPAANEGFFALAKALHFRRNAGVDFSLFQPRMCYVTDLRGHTPQSLLMLYSRSKRYDVKLAQKRGVTAAIGTKADLPAFYALMQKTAKKNGFCVAPLAHYERILTQLDSKLYIARKGEAVIAASIAIVLGKRMWHMYACSDFAYHADCANELLQWEMQSDALSRGCSFFDFRGAEGYPTADNPKIGLHRYKQGFGSEFVEYIGQLDLVYRPMMERIILYLQRFH